MAVVRKYRETFYCDLESERDLAWGEGTLIFCKENGGKWWKIVANAFQQNTSENPESIDFGKVQNKPAAYTPGYVTGSGGTVSQATSKSTGVTLNKSCGAITMINSALAAATIVSFTLTNSLIAATDILSINHVSGGTSGAYNINAQCGNGSCVVTIRNNTAGSLSEALVLRFAIVKCVTS